jgi:tRNA pseudouridine38/39 synthase
MCFKDIPKIKIAFKFAYIGIDYKGLVTQANGEDTVEGSILEALKKVYLIDPEAPLFECQFARCGRTDKGVSALGNVCSLIVRKLNTNDYCSRINRCLPQDIRMLAFRDLTDLP